MNHWLCSFRVQVFGLMARLSQTLLIVVLPGSLAFWLLEVRVTRLALDSVLAELCVPWLYFIGMVQGSC